MNQILIRKKQFQNIREKMDYPQKRTRKKKKLEIPLKGWNTERNYYRGNPFNKQMFPAYFLNSSD